MEKYVYLYRITLKKKRKKPLYYFGIRVCQCLPEDDSYMGSPKTYADLWNDDSYVKTKEILKSGEYDTWLESFRDEEVELIKEGWNKFGVYNKDKNGLCLNAHAGKRVMFTNEVKAKHKKAVKEAMNRPDVKAKLEETRNRPDVKTKRKEIMKEMRNRPDVKAKRKETWNRPDVKARHKEAVKEAVNRPDVKAKRKEIMKEVMNRPDVKAKRKETLKELYKRPDVKARHKEAVKEAVNRPDVKARHKEAVKEAVNRPDVKAKRKEIMKEVMNRPDVKAKRKETFRRKRLLRQQQKSTLSLDSFFT